MEEELVFIANRIFTSRSQSLGIKRERECVCGGVVKGDSMEKAGQ